MFLIGFVVSVLTRPWHLTGFEAGTILACSGLGTVIGAVIWGRLADKIGRKRAFFWCVLMFTMFTLASVFTPERGWIMLAVLRVLVGMGVGGLNIVSIPYVQEFVPAKQRGLLAGLASVFIPVGLFLGALAQQIFHDHWRALIALGALPIFLLSGYARFQNLRVICSPRREPLKPPRRWRGRWNFQLPTWVRYRRRRNLTAHRTPKFSAGIGARSWLWRSEPSVSFSVRRRFSRGAKRCFMTDTDYRRRRWPRSSCWYPSPTCSGGWRLPGSQTESDGAGRYCLVELWARSAH